MSTRGSAIGRAVGPMRNTGRVASWSPLREKLASVDDRVTIAWGDLDVLVGGLPRSAYDYQAFWSGDRSGWPGFTTTDVRVGRSVTFVRRDGSRTTARDEPRTALIRTARPAQAPDLVLVGCVKQKRSAPSPAQELYTSALFRKARAYVEQTGARWFILSAKHGLVRPTAVLEPYDLAMAATPTGYRREWARQVVCDLEDAVGSLDGMSIEIHAGSAYSGSLRPLLESRGAVVVEPLQGLRQGERLAWYGHGHGVLAAPNAPVASDLATQLTTPSSRRSPGEFLATNGRGLRSPGLYSWWVDADGAADLAVGLGEPVAEA